MPSRGLAVMRLLLFLVGVSLVLGCRVGPDFMRPAAPIEPHWKQAPENGLVWASTDTCQWWTEFCDPVMDHFVELAVQNNPDLQEACFRILEARAQRGVVTGELYPEVSATSSYAYKRISGNGSPYVITSAGSFDLYSSGFDAAWEIDLWGKLRRAVEAANADLRGTVDDYNDVLVTLLGDTAAQYVEVRTLQERLRIARENRKSQEETLDLVEKRFHAGLVRELDVAQARFNVHSTAALVPALEAGLERATNRLSILCGEAPRSLEAELGTEGTIPTADHEMLVGVPAELLRRRPDVRSAENEVAAASAMIGVAKADLYPQLSLTGTITVDSTDFVTLFSPLSIAHNVGPSFTWNILNFGRVRNQIGVQRARYHQAVYRYRSTVLSAAEEVENAMAGYAREQDRLRSLRRAVEAAMEAVRLSEVYYRRGVIDFQSVLDSQRQLLRLQEQETGSRAAVTLNRIALYKALGGGW